MKIIEKIIKKTKPYEALQKEHSRVMKWISSMMQIKYEHKPRSVSRKDMARYNETRNFVFHLQKILSGDDINRYLKKPIQKETAK